MFFLYYKLLFISISPKNKIHSDYLAHSSKHICKEFITKHVKYLSQNVPLQNVAAFLLQKVSILLQYTASITKHCNFITKNVRYYTTHQLLQNGALQNTPCTGISNH